MGILDDAIREHLDLKRRHGARDAELREIEDEAFGAGDQSDPYAAGGELFGDVTAAGAAEVAVSGGASAGTIETPPPDLGNEEPTRLVEPDEPDLGSYEEEPEAPESAEPIPGQTELPGQDEIPGQERLDQPAESYEAPIEPAPEPAMPSESLEELIADEEPFPEDAEAPAPEPPSEPESSVPEPPPPPPAEPAGRARGRIDVPTQEHPPPGETGDVPAMPAPEPEPAPQLEAEPEPAPAESSGPALYDFETDDESLGEAPVVEPSDEFDVLGPADEELPYLDEEEPYAEEPASGTGVPLDEPPTEDRPAVEPRTEVRPGLEEEAEDEEAYAGPSDDPEESYEEGDTDDELWFEKGPPKDFDFD